MTVIEFAEERLNESCINDDDEAVLYWTEWKSTDCFGWTLESPYTN